VTQSPVQLTDAKSQAVFRRESQGMTTWRLVPDNRLRLGVCQLHCALAISILAPVASAQRAYVTNEVSQDLTVIATASDSVVATIPLGARARGVKVSPDGRFVYVALSGSPRCPPTMPDEECAKLPADKSKDGIAELDVATHKVVRILPGGSDPEQFDLSPDGSRLYVSNEDAGVASILDLKSAKLVATVPVGTEPEGVAVSPDGKAVYVTAETDHVVTALDAATGKELARVKVGRRPRDLAFSPDGRRLYVSAEVDGTVSVIDVPQHRVIAVITLPKGALPMGVEVSPDGKRVYVAGGRGGTVEVIDAETNKIIGSVKVGRRPWGIALTPDGEKLYAANGPSDDVSVVDTESLRVVATITAGKSPWGVAIGRAPSP
jgi:PQQ-dependent catabolism-associated beta-propeller protein